MAVNLTAPQRLMRAVLPGMMARGRGAIVNVASEAGLKGGCAGAAYTASKHGLIGLTKNSAFLYAKRGIRVNAVAPGPVETGMTPDFRSAIAAERLPAILAASIARVAQPAEIAAVIAWLLDDQAGAVNGAILAADGGWSAA
jgi:NAD(P)-dependent dehydrogenase (short-subunit alcohol dehydrogenase family)